MILATRNRHKAREIGAILGLECLTLDDVPGSPPLIEEGETFAENAAAKAAQLAAWLVEAAPAAGPAGALDRVLADDSGLEVDALGGAPGVYSARFAAMESGASGNSTDAENNARLLGLLGDLPYEKRTARFRCALALVDIQRPAPAGQLRLFEGACEGRIQFAPSGGGGFGYDPLFVPDGFEQSFAELGEEIKNRISHRARALARLREWLGHPGGDSEAA